MEAKERLRTRSPMTEVMLSAATTADPVRNTEKPGYCR